MKRRLLFTLICLSLMIFGNSYFNNVNAQTRGNRTTPSGIQREGNKGYSSADKLAAIEKTRREKISSTNAVTADGDPCTTFVPISLNQTITGSLNTGDCKLDADNTFVDYYSFNGTAGQAVSISMNSSDFDTYLFLRDSEGNIIQSNDDSGNGSNSRIPADPGVIILPYTGQYVIGANSYEIATGQYTLTLNSGGNCTPTAISFNQTINGTLTNTDCAVNYDGDIYYTDLYTFYGTAGQEISISMNSTVVDSYLILTTPSGKASPEDNDGGGGFNARIPASGTYVLPETGTYTIQATTFNSFELGAYTLTLTGPNVPAATRTKFDFDGDGKADISVFRPSNGVWYLQQSQNGFTGAQFGDMNDKIVPADYDGDGKTDLAVYRAGIWYLQRSTAGFTGISFGAAGDIPQPADFDGDGKAELVVFRPSNSVWYFYNLVNNQFTFAQFGIATDKPVAADYDGDGKADLAVYREGQNAGDQSYTYYRPSGTSGVDFVTVQLGVKGDKPVPADYDGDGKTDVAVFRPSNGVWYIQRSTAGFTGIQFGISTDKPVPADYDGDGKADVAVYRDGNWYLNRTTAGFTGVAFGTATDKPVPNAFIQ